MTPTKQRCNNLRRSRRIRSKACVNVAALPFPFLVDTHLSPRDRSPHTPVRGSTRYAGYHPGQTHPSTDDPFYSSPVIGLRFNKTDQGTAIAHEGAVILGGVFESPGHKHYEVKRAYKSGIGFCSGSTYRSIKVGLEEEGGDANFPKFDPGFLQSSWSLRRRVNGLEEPTGITLEELQQFCAQCERCENFVTQTSRAYHECHHGAAANQAGSPGSDHDIFRSPEFRLDAVGKDSYSLGGVTKEEFEGHFSMCINCKRILTASGRTRHTDD